MRIVYRTEDRVINHINALRRAYGFWPGYFKVRGGYALTFDPDTPRPDDGDSDGYGGDDSGEDWGPWRDELADDDEAA